MNRLPSASMGYWRLNFTSCRRRSRSNPHSNCSASVCCSRSLRAKSSSCLGNGVLCEWLPSGPVSLTSSLPRNLRPGAAPTLPLPPGEGGPKGRVREGGWFVGTSSLTPSLSRGERGSWFADASSLIPSLSRGERGSWFADASSLTPSLSRGERGSRFADASFTICAGGEEG